MATPPSGDLEWVRQRLKGHAYVQQVWRVFMPQDTDGWAEVLFRGYRGHGFPGKPYDLMTAYIPPKTNERPRVFEGW